MTQDENGVSLRSAYTFWIKATDDKLADNPEGWKSMTVDVLNRTTALTGSTVPGSSMTDPVPNFSIDEDRDDRATDKSFLVDVSAYDEDQNRTGLIDAHYTLDYWDGTQWQPITAGAAVGWNPNGGGTVTYDKDTGRIDWIPTDRDVDYSVGLGLGVYRFQVTQYDDNGTHDADVFDVTVTNKAPDFAAGTTTPKFLVEDSTDQQYYKFDIATDDEAAPGGSGKGVTYTLSYLVASDSFGGPYNVVDQHSSTDGAGHLHYTEQINGSQGGWVDVDTVTGVVEWRTTNVDVNYGRNPDDSLGVNIDANQKTGSRRKQRTSMMLASAKQMMSSSRSR